MNDRYVFAGAQRGGPGGERTTGPTDSIASPEVQNRAAAVEQGLVARLYEWHDGTRNRVAMGKHSDGKYGLRVWNSAGALVHDLTTT